MPCDRVAMALFVGEAVWQHAKGGCYVCGRGDRLVSTEVQIEGEGILVLCTGCITDLAEVAGLTFNEAYVRELRSELEAERKAREEAETIKRTLLDAFREAARTKTKGARYR